MFGRVRASPSPSPSPLDSLEAPPSKIIKDDSFSIYEATLMKLKLGSQRHLISPATEEADSASETVVGDLTSEAMNVEATCASGSVSKSFQDISSNKEMIVDSDCSSTSASNSLSDCQSAVNLNSRQTSNSVSILYLFSKFKSCQRAPTPTMCNEAMMVENDGAASFSSSSECQSLSGANEQGNQESSTTIS